MCVQQSSFVCMCMFRVVYNNNGENTAHDNYTMYMISSL